jgi:hypothetical protein
VKYFFVIVEMAKQAGNIKFTGTIDNICFYKMDGEYFVRRKSSLEGKRVKKDPVFKRTMQYAHLLAKASKIASGIYKNISKEDKSIKMYREIVGKVMRELKKREVGK